ncbi:MAG: tRNA (N6-threonylcarbamoyladenosine(37)-N6)-methyltransferase TrmO [Coriobacteriia bacterium]|nr:tRNA (N6-threonylcarbamoyladenosine(37)-N6)-methyltransferase TrmO [Coriobacteriia bacterium]
MQVIAHIHTDFPQKFGIPRQSGIAPDAQGVIVFEPEFAVNDAVRGLEGFSHVWLIWRFENGEEAAGADAVGATAWSPTVRPPRLGGHKRLGVFATRSPYRPNPLGLSCVRLERVELTDAGPLLHVRGADLRDGTAIYDIKPYLPYTDSHPEAESGFAKGVQTDRWLQVDFPQELLAHIPAEKQSTLLDVLRQDPRPAFAKDSTKAYALAFATWDVKFTVTEGVLTVVDVQERNK